MDIMVLYEIYQNFQWVFSLGYVIIFSIIATILLVKLERATILKRVLKDATNSQQDSILGLAGTITSLVVFLIFHFANEMIIQGKFLIDFNAVIQSISIPSGAAIVWSASKGIYTVFHKWWKRVKAGETLNLKQISEEMKKETENPTLSLSEAMNGSATYLEKKSAKKVVKAKAKKKLEKQVINNRSGENDEV